MQMMVKYALPLQICASHHKYMNWGWHWANFATWLFVRVLAYRILDEFQMFSVYESDNSWKHFYTNSYHIRGILSQQPKTEWKCAYNELLSSSKGLQQKDDLLSGPTRKRSKTSQDLSNGERQRVRFKAETTDSGAETSTCPTCLQVIAKESNDFDCLMEKTVNWIRNKVVFVFVAFGRGR